jgi:hypothetical protein
MIGMLTPANAAPIMVPGRHSTRAIVFAVETNFQRMARRPGGLSRQQALMNAQRELLQVAIPGRVPHAKGDA